MQLNAQIVVDSPFHEEDMISWAKIVQIRANRNQKGEIASCPICKGQKQLKHGEKCRKCNGTGKGIWVWAIRAEPKNNDQINELSIWIDNNQDSIISIQQTIHLQETGGGFTNTGRATIICGLKGEKLLAVYGTSKCNATHAVFYVNAALVVRYHHHRGNGSGSVEFVGIDRNIKHHLGFECIELWKFNNNLNEIECVNIKRSKPFDFPIEAVKAAINKSKCYHCRSAFYAIDGANGPSGALRGAGANWEGAPLPSPYKGPGIGY